ncbi:hypothetical protein [Streptomyces sp. 8L]|uniref:hypothetical protein n=1 Tax=Streptomyces sp. 8L TaxID=2877242 RepID=UPI001CD629FB|nr:hypothetical protein [Streptomyces sp. 8L]MCA1222863.1 hypothetical protein [Streptomyces sp. 8L]
MTIGFPGAVRAMRRPVAVHRTAYAGRPHMGGTAGVRRGTAVRSGYAPACLTAAATWARAA